MAKINLDAPLRSRERAALDIAVRALRKLDNSALDYWTALAVGTALDKIAAIIPKAVP